MPSANTLVRWVNENAFASIVQARPCPTFGRPVHLRGSPHRLRPGTSPHALRIPPRDGHPALRRTAGGGFRSALACIRLSPSCPFRLLHTFPFSGPRGITPAFGYGAPHPSARGTSTLLSNALLSAHYGQSAPELRIRTLALVVLPLVASPLASESQVPTFRLTASWQAQATSHAGCRSARKQVSSELDPAVTITPRF